MTSTRSSLTSGTWRRQATRNTLLAALALAAPLGAQTAPDEPEGWLAAAAADRIAEETLGRSDRHGAIRLDDGSTMFLYGEADDVEHFLGGDQPTGIAGVVVSASRSEAVCAGVVSDLGGEAQSPGAAASWTVEHRERWRSACPGSTSNWSDLLREEQRRWEESSSTQSAFDLTKAACTAPCGPDDGLSYAGQIAYSNGTSTGTGSSCDGATTDRYQCTQFVDRVHGHYGGTINWTGNALPYYWSDLGNGPYQKGLLPLGSGTSTTAPLAGDVLVWSGGTFGHIGIIASVGTSSLTVYDQNRSCGSQSCVAGYSTSTGYTITNNTCFTSTSGYGLAPNQWTLS